MKDPCSFLSLLFAGKTRLMLCSLAAVSLFAVSPSYAKDCVCDAAGCSNGDGVIYSSHTFDLSQCTTINGQPYPPVTQPPATPVTPDTPSTPDTPVIPVPESPHNDQETTNDEEATWEQVASLSAAHTRMEKREDDVTWSRNDDSLRPTYLLNSTEYQASDIPIWNFIFSVQGRGGESEIELTPTLGRKSDVKSLAVNVNGSKEFFHFRGRLYYTALEGTGANSGEDIDNYGLSIMPGYTVFNQQENGFSLDISPFLEYSSNNFAGTGNQNRIILGGSIHANTITPVGGIGLGYIFSHDRNLDNDVEITGDEYLNLNSLSVQYFLPLTSNLFFSSDLGYLWVMDMPDEMDDDSSLDLKVGLSYRGWEDWIVRMQYKKSLDGFESQGVNLFIGYVW